MAGVSPILRLLYLRLPVEQFPMFLGARLGPGHEFLGSHRFLCERRHYASLLSSAAIVMFEASYLKRFRQKQRPAGVLHNFIRDCLGIGH